MKLVFWTDILSTLNPHKDTSYILMLGAQERGHQIFIVYQNDIHCHKGFLYFYAKQVHVSLDKNNAFQIIHTVTLYEKDIDCFFIRKDPPFDKSYLEITWLLSIMSQRVLVTNSPYGIRNISEKIWVNQLDSFVPNTLITSSKTEFCSFFENYQKVILKPIDGFGGRSVFLISKQDSNAMVAFETLSNNGTEYVVVQQFIEDSVNGDKRLLVFNGEILGQFVRLNSTADHRNNIAAGGKPIASKITNTDRQIVEKIRPFLLENQLHFVGLDVMGGYLIEVNVTSPTGLQELNKLYNTNKHIDIIKYFEKRIKNKSVL